ncbi:MAG: rod shape-determining protein [Eubacteriales bacterium]|nr:rod shape-determining protein [Eubacteriales bacterium]
MDFNTLTNDIAIDFGTSNTRIYIKGRGLVLDEPSVIAFDTVSGETVAAGCEAYNMIGKTPASVSTVFPLSGGVISDCTLAEELLKELLRKACPKTVIKPRIIISVPSGATDVEKRALRDAAIIAGARVVYIMETPIAAAIGAKCDVMPARGLMIADIGGGCCDFAAISLGQVASFDTFKTAGNAFTEAVIAHMRDYHSLSIGYLTAERCKIEAGSVFPAEKSSSVVRGLSLKTGLPTEITVSSDELTDALLPVSTSICNALKAAVDNAPSELLGDIVEDGILLTGACASMRGMVKRLKTDTEMKLYLAPENEYAVIRGLAGAIESIDKISKDLYTVYHS